MATVPNWVNQCQALHRTWQLATPQVASSLLIHALSATKANPSWPPKSTPFAVHPVQSSADPVEGIFVRRRTGTGALDEEVVPDRKLGETEDLPRRLVPPTLCREEGR